MPSPVPEQPGLLLRDPFRYTESILIVPPGLARALALFDGEHTELDLRKYLSQATGEIEVSEPANQFVRALDENGFLHSDTFFEMRDQKHKAFAAATERSPAHAGAAYPNEPEPLAEKLNVWGATSGEGGSRDLVALAAPHVSPDGGYKSYAAAYSRLRPEHASKTFVILGTSHYGRPETFGLTRKAYQTPLGLVETDQTFVDRLAEKAGDAVLMEDYCHASEHSIEFQSVFLQHVVGSSLPEGERLRAVPILCGPLAESLVKGELPEKNEQARRFFDVLGELAEERRDDLIFVLGIDLAHIGRRYGDSFVARAHEGEMTEVRRRDEERLECVCAGDAEGFYDLVRPNGDDLRWCGYSSTYTFLRSVSGCKGKVLNYEQWNIDEQSVVSFVGAEFVRG